MPAYIVYANPVGWSATFWKASGSSSSLLPSRYMPPKSWIRFSRRMSVDVVTPTPLRRPNRAMNA